MYEKIVNPHTGRKVNVNGTLGHKIINNYLYQLGGSNGSTATLKDENGNSLELSKDEALQLELKLNLTKHGHEWSHIGDFLYKFSVKNSDKNVLIITSEQFNDLKELNR